MGINIHKWEIFVGERGEWDELTREAEEAMKYKGPHPTR